MVFKQVELLKIITCSAENFGRVQHHVEKISSNVAHMSKEIDTEPLNQAAEMEKPIEKSTVE